jgi:TolA-binding protein
MQLRPVSYDKKIGIKETEYNTHEFGFIAQELQKTFPTLVSEGSDKDKILSVNYFAIIPILTKAIQEQQNSITSLQSQIDDLNKKIESLIEK